MSWRRGSLLEAALALVTSAGPGLAQEQLAQQQNSAPAQTAADASLARAARELFDTSCVRCHGPSKAKGGLRLDQLAWDPADDETLAHWQDVLDRLAAGEMPPEEEPRPAPESVATLCDALRTAFATLEVEARTPRILRRLNQVQYRNTLRDLLSIDVVLEDPTSTFPTDDTFEGFTVLAEGQVMSDFLLRQVLRAARSALDLATFAGPRPEPETHRMFDPDDARPGNFAPTLTQPEDGLAFLFLNDERAPGDPRGQVLTSSWSGASAPGWYEFSLTVESKGRGSELPHLQKEVRPDCQVVHPEDLHRLELYLAPPRRLSPFQSRRRVLVESLDLSDDEVVTLTRRYWLAEGWRLEAAFGNAFAGTVDLYLTALGARPIVEQFLGVPNTEKFARLAQYTHAEVARTNAPRIVIHAGSERGPFHDTWPPPSHVAAYGDPEAPLATRLAAFASRAFRRPVAESEIGAYVRLAEESPEGQRTALEAILCSPRFLYLLEPEGELDDWALAARLSYFLWNTLPDEPLRALAAAGRLRDPAVLRAEAARLLADARAVEFVEHFTWGWLGLQNALDMAPDPVRFPEYHRSRLEAAGVAETRAFFRHALEENRPLAELLDADYAFVNADLARLYGIEGVHTTARFQRVSLPAERRRGGLLGQASILTASANGVDTSPVVRGMWVLDHLLGTPPDPPPPDVPIPEPDARGAQTIREMLAKHASIESCNECHKSIDPLGFALESFDAIGRWRETYESGRPVDASGRMPDGTLFEDARGMKAALLGELPLFTRNLVHELSAYAAGRTLRPADRMEIDRIAARAAEPGFGLRDLLLAVVDSRLFRHR